MLLNDIEILQAAPLSPMLSGQEANGVISYGLSSFGYDIRLGTLFRFPMGGRVLDPKDCRENDFATYRHEEPFLLAGNSWVLGESVEVFDVPKTCLGICLGKSTYARVGIFVNVTPLEPGWTGTLTVEIANLGPNPVCIYPNEGIAQIIFLVGNRPEKTYNEREIQKYQGQHDVQIAKVISNINHFDV